MTAADVQALFAAQLELDPRVVDLARALSLATRIESALVRRMRLALFRDTDAGLEANLWFGPLVEDRDLMGIALVPGCRDQLRRELTLPKHRETLQRAWEVIVAAHHPGEGPGVAPVVNLQELVTFHALAAAAFDQAGGHRESMQLEFGTLINALDEDSEGTLAEWVAGALPTLPESARQSAGAIALAEKLRQRHPEIVLQGVPQPMEDARGRGTGGWAGITVEIGCRRRTDGIELSAPPAPGSHVLHLPKTSPLVLDVRLPARDGWHSRAVEFEPVPLHVIPDPAPGSTCRITTAAGRRVSVRPMFGSRRPALEIFNTAADGHVDGSEFQNDIRWTCAELGWNVSFVEQGELGPSNAPDAALVRSSARHVDEALAGPVVDAILASGRPVVVWTPHRMTPVGGAAPQLLTLAHGANVFAAEFSRDSKFIALGGEAGVQLWDVAASRLFATLDIGVPCRAVSLGPDGTQAAVGFNDGTVRLWTPPSEARDIGRHDDWVMSVEFSGSGARIATSSQDHTAVIWNTDSGGREAVFRHNAPVNHASLSPDEARVATASDDDTAVIWGRNGQQIATLRHEAEVRSVQWSPNGQWLLTADAAGDVWLWDAATFERDRHPFHHDDEIHFATFSPDGRRVAVATADGSAWIWHVRSKVLMCPPIAHADVAPDHPPPARSRRGRRAQSPRAVHSVAFSPDGLRLLTAGADGRGIVWALAAAQSEGTRPSGVSAHHGRARTVVETTEWILESVRAQLLAFDEQRLLAWLAAGGAVAAPDVPAAPPVGEGDDGRNALVGIIDDGIDVLHQAFLDEHGKSRIVAIWDQRDSSGPPPEGFESGTLHTEGQIASYVASGQVPSALGRNAGGHGTAMASTAAGRKAGSFGGGAAPGARIVVVIWPSEPAGYASSHASALAYIDRISKSRQAPVVVAIGTGLYLGAHDGTSALETMFDGFAGGGGAPGRVVVAAAGLRGGSNAHARVQVPAATVKALSWNVSATSTETLRVELWWKAHDSYRFRLHALGKDVSGWIGPDATEIKGTFEGMDASYQMRLIRRHVDNGDSQLAIDIDSTNAVSATWTVDIEAVEVTEGKIDAWMGRASGQAGFVNHSTDEGSISQVASARSVIAVGAVEAGTPARVAAFSALGPTRDGRAKPDVAAVGVDISAARGGTAAGIMPRSGTSLAAAHVAGVVARLLSVTAARGGIQPTANQIVVALRQTTVNYNGQWDPGHGYGVVDPAKFLTAFDTSPRAQA